MGNSQPQNKTGKKATIKKLENAEKLGILSLSEHSLEHVPEQVLSSELSKLRTLDLSKNSLTRLGRIDKLRELKSLNVEQNHLPSGSLDPIVSCSKLQNLVAGGNKLGQSTTGNSENAISALPESIRQLNLSSNFLSNVPKAIHSPPLLKLEKLDLSKNRLTSLPIEISYLCNLQDLNLDDNEIVRLSEDFGRLRTLKALSLRNNKLTVVSTIFSDKNPQPLPKSLFENTLLIDLNLHGNKLTNTQLNEFEGFKAFLDRRQKVKSKTMSNLSVCGLN